MNESIIESRRSLLDLVGKQIDNLIHHISAKTLKEEDFGIFTKLFEAFIKSQQTLITVNQLTKRNFDKENRWINSMSSELINIRSCWRNNTNIELSSIIRLRNYFREFKRAVEGIHY